MSQEQHPHHHRHQQDGQHERHSIDPRHSLARRGSALTTFKGARAMAIATEGSLYSDPSPSETSDSSEQQQYHTALARTCADHWRTMARSHAHDEEDSSPHTRDDSHAANTRTRTRASATDPTTHADSAKRDCYQHQGKACRHHVRA